jgi:CheY-like chemotaxis protein
VSPSASAAFDIAVVDAAGVESAENGADHESERSGPAGTRRLHAVPGCGEPGCGEPGGDAAGGAVLLVEDDPSMQLLCRVNLELSGFEVVAASTGTEALRLAETAGPFDLVLLDVMLPDLGGFDVAERLHETAATVDVPIVFLSARVSPADVARGRSAGAIDYVPKPFDPTAFVGRLRDDLDLYRRSGAGVVRALRFGPAQEP